jgi:hypothetical protein
MYINRSVHSALQISYANVTSDQHNMTVADKFRVVLDKNRRLYIKNITFSTIHFVNFIDMFFYSDDI